ncbi:phosphatidylinositol-specific phospholipase C/glycerophosphodiester phosphodiesterase family protein [Allonocardiopsis opalescens]|uniref:Altered inheritance of mitochondria protein 6 n=1 Tax=Allonocardiopsis opalescens TaxID=1144618 RepID=A0A2T0Q2A3_9ACTN|nr:phosphatidylinositol-specific phospholipase C/glycerophosphodiester phosphodiesterase family protein [Allonocardiopsis opalescens]PRX97808.1 glycerophosphoryl diester phosphodiesterase family protein [Allonocardiopsis opalescens]
MSRLPKVFSPLAVLPLTAALVLSAVLPAAAEQLPAGDAEPLDQAHAHNDYEHDRPLLDALDHGFTSVEADVWLVDGELLVAHDREDVRPGRTLQSLYLDPLRAITRANGGSVYPGWDGSLQLLIDIKNEGAASYTEIDRVLRRYAGMMTRFTDDRVHEGAVTAVISGERPRALMESQRLRFAGYDGRLPDLATGTPAAFMPLVSDNWTNHFDWTGEGPMPADERERLHALVADAHAAGYRLRFWATPDTPGPARDALWTELAAAGVDHLNTDDLAGLRDFLLARR